NVDLVTRNVTVPTIAGALFPDGDNLAAGSDQITGDAGNDIVFGDHGSVTQLAGIFPVLTTGNVVRIETANAAAGLADTIDGGTGNDFLLGGNGGDTITDALGENVIFGDFGYVNLTPANTNSPIDQMGTLNPEIGGTNNDIITAGLSDTVHSDLIF